MNKLNYIFGCIHLVQQLNPILGLYFFSLRDSLGKPDVIFQDSPLTSLDMSGKTGNESSHILLFQNHETVV